MKFDCVEPQHCEDIKGIVALKVGAKSFGTFEKQASGVFQCTELLCCFHATKVMNSKGKKLDLSPGEN